MGTLIAGTTNNITISAGETLRISGTAEISLRSGSIESVNSSGTYGPFDVTVSASVKAISACTYDTAIEGAKPAFIYDESGVVGIKNSNGQDIRLQGSQISSKYRFFIPGQQFIGSGDAKDKSGNGADAARLASLTDAAAWANPGYITSGAGANAGLTIPAAKFAFDLAYQSIIFSVRIKKVGPVGAESILGCGDGASAQGFYISMRAASSSVSKVRPVLNTSGGVVTGLADSLATFGEAAATDHVLTLAIDGITKSVFLYCDGTLSNTYTTAFTGGTTTSTAFGIGSNTGAVGAVSVAGQFSGIHMLVMDGGLPLNLGLIAQKLASQPHYYLTDLDFEF